MTNLNLQDMFRRKQASSSVEIKCIKSYLNI